ncbi:MAG: CoA-transferase [Actinomycetota bacterium]
MTDLGFSRNEMMIVQSARWLEGEKICFVGVGMPNIAVNLAKRTVSPDIQMVYEAGVFGAEPMRLALSIGDPTLVTGATAVTSQFDLFAFYLQAGLIDVGFLQGAEIDRHGNLNTTVIGDYARPKVRLPGSGGAVEIAMNARRVFIIMPQKKRSFVEELSFQTSPGHASDPAVEQARGWLGAGPYVVITDLGEYRFDEKSGEMTLVSMHAGVTLGDIRENTGWEMKVADDVRETPAPTDEELRLIREELDPEGVYSR